MRWMTLGVVLAGSAALLACGSDDAAGIRRGPAPGGGSSADVTPPGAPPGPSDPVAAACPADVPAAKSIASDAAAADVRVVRDDVYYRDSLKVLRVKKDGSGRAEIYTSVDLVRAFADEAMLVTIESPNPPDAVLKVMPLGGQASPEQLTQTVTPSGWTAAGTYVFASDAKSFYVLADVANQGDTIYKVDKANPQLMTALATLQAPLSDPQLAGTDIWFVRDGKRVYRIAQAAYDPAADPGLDTTLPPLGGEAQPPTEVFGLGYASCKLAVSGTHAFCSTGKALEQRDLSGANMKTVLDGEKGASPTVFGGAVVGNEDVLVRALPATPTDALKHGIRAVKADGSSRVIACGREPIEALTVDSTSVIWAEKGRGVFVAPR